MFDRCPTCHRRPKHSDKQKGYYWVMLGRLAVTVKPGGQEFSPETWHEYFAERFLGFAETTLPNGKISRRRKSISDLDRDEFTDYQMQVTVHALEEFHFWMPDREAA